MHITPQKTLLAVLACGTAFVVFRATADNPEQNPDQATSAPILLAQAATPTPAPLGAVGGGTATATGTDNQSVHADWKLVWEDDFSKDGGKIDPKKWAHVVGGGGFGNHESEFYTDDPKNSQIKDGVLVMTALKEDKGSEHYTSAKLWTQGLYSVQYGRIEASIKVPSAQNGNWPAFWMMPDDNNKYGGWPKSGEIDIMEMVNDAKTLHGTIHYGTSWRDSSGASIVAPNGDFSTDYHVYAVEWDPTEFRLYLDGKIYGKVTKWQTPGHDFPAPYDQKFYIILNFALGGDWPDNVVSGQHRHLPDPDAKFPQTMSVKWVRVYQAGTK